MSAAIKCLPEEYVVLYMTLMSGYQILYNHPPAPPMNEYQTSAIINQASHFLLSIKEFQVH
jgi:hypothetical protein